MWEGGSINALTLNELLYLYLSPDTCLLCSLTQSFTRGECMERKIMSSRSNRQVRSPKIHG